MFDTIWLHVYLAIRELNKPLERDPVPEPAWPRWKYVIVRAIFLVLVAVTVWAAATLLWNVVSAALSNT